MPPPARAPAAQLRRARVTRRHRRHLGPVPLPGRAQRLGHVHPRLLLLPWTEAKAIADGGSILQYVRRTAREYGVEDRIRYHHRVVRASWSSADATWTVTAERTDAAGAARTVELTCSFLYVCSGYYRYDQGYTPDFAGIEDFTGQVVHPQHWPQDLDYAGKRVVVIGSGATAVTLVPAMAEQAAQVTMLQRSPPTSSRSSRDVVAQALGRVLPARAAARAARWKNIRVSSTATNSAAAPRR
ncbi:flavin-containing monooxygenase [Streptacidiphilus monticola]